MQQCDSLILRTRGLWGLKDAVFDGDFGLLVLGYFGGSNLSGRTLRGHVSGDVNMGQTITVVRAGDGGRASEALAHPHIHKRKGTSSAVPTLLSWAGRCGRPAPRDFRAPIVIARWTRRSMRRLRQRRGRRSLRRGSCNLQMATVTRSLHPTPVQLVTSRHHLSSKRAETRGS